MYDSRNCRSEVTPHCGLFFWFFICRSVYITLCTMVQEGFKCVCLVSVNMLRGKPTSEQERIMRKAQNMFDLDWIQATGPNTINFDVDSGQYETLKRFMSIHGYKHWVTFRKKDDGFTDVSFVKQ